MATNSSGQNTQGLSNPSDIFGTSGSAWGQSPNTNGLGGGLGSQGDAMNTKLSPTPATSGPAQQPFNMYDPGGSGQGAFSPGGQQQGIPDNNNQISQAPANTGQEVNPFSGLVNPSILDGSYKPATYQPQATNYYSATGSSPGGGAYQPSPYLDQQAKNITTQYNQNLNESVLPGVRDKFIGSGGLGGSRQGIAEGLAIGRSNQGLASALTNMYGTDYENSQNRSLQGQIASMNAATSANNAYMGNNTANRSLDMNDALQRLNSERSFYSTNRGQDLTQTGLAQGLLNNANQGYMGQGAGLADLGGQGNADMWRQIQNYAGLIQPNVNAGSSQTGYTTSTSNPWMQAAGLGMMFVPGMAPLGAAALTRSDRRLKTDIEKVGKTDGGLNIYKYRYKDGGPMQMGVMAQEVEKKHPEAVGTMPSGYKGVNYGLLG